MIVDLCSIMYNESALLKMWIEGWLSVSFVNRIYLVDGGSTDFSVEIAKSYDRDSVVSVPWKNDFSRQRNIAIKLGIVLPYVKFYDWKMLWFFKDGHTPRLNGDLVEFGTKSTMTIFKKGHLTGYSKSLHEMPIFAGNEKPLRLGYSCNLDGLGKNGFLIGHYDQAKHFEQAKENLARRIIPKSKRKKL